MLYLYKIVRSSAKHREYDVFLTKIHDELTKNREYDNMLRYGKSTLSYR